MPAQLSSKTARARVRLRIVMAAATHQGIVGDVELEAVGIADACHEWRELVRRNVEHSATFLAHDVRVRSRQMEERGAVAAMHVLHQAPRLERFEGPVDGGHMNLRMRTLDILGDAFGSVVLVRAAEKLDDRPSSGRDASAFGAQYVDCPGGRVTHRCSHSVS